MSNLFAAIVYVSLGIVCFVVVVGGIVCITDGSYDFNEYITDLTGIYKVLLTAVVSAVGHAYVDRTMPAKDKPANDR